MNRRFILILLSLLGFLSLALYWNLFVTNQATVAARLLVNILTPLNSLLMLVLVFLLFRTFVKLYLENRGNKSGFRLRTKLVLGMLPLTLVPAAMMFLFSYPLPERILENLKLDAETSELYRASQVLVDGYFMDTARLLRSHGPAVAELLKRGRGQSSAQRQAVLQRYVEQSGLPGLEIYREGEYQGRAVHQDWSAQEPRIAASARYFIDPGPNPARFEDGSALWRIPYASGEWVIHFLQPKEEAFTRSAQFVRVSGEAKNMLERKRKDVASLYQSTLLIGTFAVIFGGIWLGLTFSRTFLKAFGTLAEGAHRVERGDFDTHIALETGDELEEVVQAFNKMTQALSRNQAELRQKAADLERLNALLQSETRYSQTLLQRVSAGIASCNPDGQLRTINPAACQMLHLGREEAATENVNRPLDLQLEEMGLPSLARALRQVLKDGGGGFSGQLELNTPGGETRSLHASLVPLQEEDRVQCGPSQGALLVLEDLTPLLHAQKLAAWREVAQRIAHEIKNPLTPIQLSAQRMLRKTETGAQDLPAAVQSGAETILAETRTLKRLVDEFSTFAKMPEPERQDCDLVALVRQWVEANGEAAGASRLHLECSLASARGLYDPSQLRQVLANLINNALQASPPGSTIEIRLWPDASENWLRLEVVDEGSGIAPEEREAIFLPYFSRSPKGMGLGLAIVKRIVEDHGGTIEAQENQPRGSRLVLRLPLQPAGPASQGTADGNGIATGGPAMSGPAAGGPAAGGPAPGASPRG